MPGTGWSVGLFIRLTGLTRFWIILGGIGWCQNNWRGCGAFRVDGGLQGLVGFDGVQERLGDAHSSV